MVKLLEFFNILRPIFIEVMTSFQHMVPYNTNKKDMSSSKYLKKPPLQKNLCNKPAIENNLIIIIAEMVGDN